jgi:predicted negative regulator of RcsB-dependent stress response
MAQHLDLEEQEQLDQLKAFWAQYGNIISWVLIVVFGSIAAWNGWQYWQRTQAANAAVLFDQVDAAARSGDSAKLQLASADIKSRFARTTFASQAAAIAAKAFYDAGNTEAAQKELNWLAENGADEAYKATAKLRLAALLIDSKTYDQAQALLSGQFPEQYAGLVADRKGDLLMAQGKRIEAKAEYEKAYKAMSEEVDYRRLVEVKLASLGVDMRTAAVAPGAAPAAAVAPAAASAPAAAPVAAEAAASGAK